MFVSGLLVLLFATALVAGLASIALAWLRLSRPRARGEGPGGSVSIIRPVSGLEPFSRETLESGFHLDHPEYELIFCAHASGDPVVALIRQLIAAHPHIPARILFGDERRSTNPKLDNCLKGWAAARHDWIVLADSNVAMPRDYLQRLFGAWRLDTGLVCSMPLGTRPNGFWAEVECAFLNGFQARWQYAASVSGFGFAQGKSMLWSRRFLESQGGLMALDSEPAEDAAATKLVRAAGLSVHLVDAPFPQPIGRRSWAQVWGRQLRWARLRRATFPKLYLLESMTSPLVAAGGLALVAPSVGVSPWLALPALAACYLGEGLLIRRLDWPRGVASLPAMLVRDGVLPLVWVAGLLGRQVSWHGRSVPIAGAVRPGETAGAHP